MSLARFQRTIVDEHGNILAGATVTVTNEATGGLAALKSDRAGASGISNPTTADSDGFVAFHVAGGAYKIVAEKDGASLTWRYEAIGTLAEFDVDAVLNAKRIKVRAATTANVTLSTALENGDTLDGVTLATGDLILVKDQTAKDDNGIRVVAASGTPARHADFDTYDEHVGALIAVTSGTVNANTLWFCSANIGGVLDTTDIEFTKITPAPGGLAADGTVMVGTVAMTGDITPTSLSADQDDYNPTGLSGAVVIRQATTAQYNINGLQGGSDGRLIVIKNAGTFPLVIGAERASSTAANRFQLQSDLTIGPGESVAFIYDATSSRWVNIGRPPRPQHIEVTPDPFPTVPHKPTVFADWSTMPWLDRYFTFTRASVGSYLDRKGILKYAPAGVPRFHSIYSSGETGLLIEGARTNLLLRSQEFGTTWTVSNASISSDAAVAPDGTTTADTLVENSANAQHLNSQTVSGVLASTTYTRSVYVKAAGRSQIGLFAFSSPTTSILAQVIFDLTTKAFTPVVGGGATQTYGYEDLPNGWIRVWQTFTLGGAETSFLIRHYLYSGGVATYLGGGTSGIYLWGAQLEAGAFPSSYIPTTSATVTRAADNCTRSNADGAINTLQNTIFAEAVMPYNDPSVAVVQHAFGLSDGSLNDVNHIRIAGPSVFQGVVVASAALSAAPQSSGTTSATFKMALAAAANDFALSTNAGAVQTDSAGAMPAVTRFDIGNGGSSFEAFGIIKRVAYWPRRISNANLQTVTT